MQINFKFDLDETFFFCKEIEEILSNGKHHRDSTRECISRYCTTVKS
jgi:hypothetical protein